MSAGLLRFDGAVQCIIVERVNRFFVAVDSDGKRRRAWINQHRAADQLHAAWHDGLLPAEGEWEDGASAVCRADGDAAAVIVHLIPDDAFERAVRQHRLPWLAGCTVERLDAPLGGSRID